MSRHPNVWLPFTKELHYFDERINEPSFGAAIVRLLSREVHPDDWYPWVWRYQLKIHLQRYREAFNLRDALWDFRYFGRSPSDKWYASLFDQEPGEIAGEITPEYATLEAGDVAHIHELMPNAKIVLLIRNPIERTYSAALWRLHLLMERKIIRGQRLEDVTDEQIVESLEHPVVKSQTNYLKTLDTWRQYYRDEQIFVGFFEDIQLHPTGMLRRLYKFLGVDPRKAPKTLKGKANARSSQQMPTWVAVHVAHAYHEDLQRLDSWFGGYASFWLYCAQRLADEPLEGDTLRFPLRHSWLWDEWKRESGSLVAVGSSDAKLQSKALA